MITAGFQILLLINSLIKSGIAFRFDRFAFICSVYILQQDTDGGAVIDDMMDVQKKELSVRTVKESDMVERVS